jgi:2-keto-3-deoxy-L-rhamnonate aldolase RhmA
MDSSCSLKERIRSRERLVGTFVKTGSYQVVEILGGVGLDFLVVDAEHAPFDRSTLDVLCLAARATGTPAIVRLPDTSAHETLNVLDLGYAGVLAPHASNRATVEPLTRTCLYRNGVRGFSNSPRSGGYGAVGMKEHIENSDTNAVVICQVEDREAIDNLSELVAIDAVDCYLIGRADLAVSLEVFDINHADVKSAVDATIQACVRANKAVGIFVADPSDIPAYSAMGVSVFIAGSDQSMLRAKAAETVRRCAEIKQM